MMLASMAKREQFRSLWLQRYDLVSKEPKENVFFFVLSNGRLRSHTQTFRSENLLAKRKVTNKLLRLVVVVPDEQSDA